MDIGERIIIYMMVGFGGLLFTYAERRGFDWQLLTIFLISEFLIYLSKQVHQ